MIENLKQFTHSEEWTIQRDIAELQDMEFSEQCFCCPFQSAHKGLHTLIASQEGIYLNESTLAEH